MMGLTRKQLILVGDSGCGKSALALRLTHALFADSYIPTTFESHSTVIDTAEGNTKLVLHDACGGVEGQELRKLAYDGCHGVLICFDLTNERSYHNVETRWIPEVRTMAPGLPIFIAGCKRDMVSNSDQSFACDQQQIAELVQRAGAAGYLECSAYTNENVDKIFVDLIEAKNQKQKSNLRKAIDHVKSLKRVL